MWGLNHGRTKLRLIVDVAKALLMVYEHIQVAPLIVHVAKALLMVYEHIQVAPTSTLSPSQRSLNSPALYRLPQFDQNLSQAKTSEL